jgi:FkbM family methyltransferase
VPFFKKTPPAPNWVKKSYSQCGEDLIVGFIFDQLEILNPTYIDVGAHHPYYLSNTALFYERGCRGLNIEPDPLLFKEFVKHRKGDINLNIGIGEKESEADFYTISSPTLNTFSKEEAENYKNEGDYFITGKISVPVNTLKNVIDQKLKGIFPLFLNVDAEGVDDLIVKSIDYRNNYPTVICVETISFSTSGKGRKNTPLIEYIKDQGYLMYADTYINTIFVKHEAWLKTDR